MSQQIQMRRGIASAWTSSNPIPFSGELCYETDTNKVKFGDGVTAWTSLPYFNGAAGITRSIIASAVSVTGLATAGVDFVYLMSGTSNFTLPSAAGNTNRYTVKNVGTGTITLIGTIDGSSNYSLSVQYQAVDLVSNGTSWDAI